MILRPESDAELIERALSVLADGSTPLDTRAMVALLILEKRLQVCPPKSEIASLLAGKYESVGGDRIARMVRDAQRGGYFVPTRGKFKGQPGRRFRYWFIVGGKPEFRAHGHLSVVDE